MKQIGVEQIEYQGRFWLSGYFKLGEQASAVTTLSPADDYLHLYAKDSSGVSTLCLKNDADAEICFPTGSGTVVLGTGAAGRVAFWDGVNSLSSDAQFLFSGTDNQLTLGDSAIATSTKLILKSSTVALTEFVRGVTWDLGMDGSNNFRLFQGANQAFSVDSSTRNITVDTLTASRMVSTNGSQELASLAAQTQGAVLFGNGTTQTFDATNFFWNNTDKRLKILGRIGVNVDPSHPLHVISVSGSGIVVGAGLAQENIRVDSLASTFSGLRLDRGSAEKWFLGQTNSGAEEFVIRRGAATNDLSISTAGQATFSGVVDVGTGYRIGNAATLGNILRGDGTNFVSSAQSGIDHGSLGGLGDDDHTQYLLLAGRSGGQIAIGGTASGDDLTLKSTSNATKGSIFLGTASVYDEANDRLGLGNLTPTSKLWLRNDSGACQSDFEGNGNVGLNFWSFAASPLPFMQGIAARGTRAAPTAVGSGDLLFRFSTFGQFSSSIGDFAEVATFAFNTSEAFTSTARGSRIQISTTKIGTTTNREVVRIDDQGFLGVQTTTPLTFLHAKDTANSAIVAQLLLQNEGAGSNTAAVAFQVASSGEYTTYGPKGGIAFERTAANGGGIFKFYNREDNDTAQYDANDLRMTLSSAGVLTLSSAAGYIDLTALTPKLFKVPTNNTDPTGGGGAATGRIPIHDAAGNLRYIAYY